MARYRPRVRVPPGERVQAQGRCDEDRHPRLCRPGALALGLQLALTGDALIAGDALRGFDLEALQEPRVDGRLALGEALARCDVIGESGRNRDRAAALSRLARLFLVAH